MKEDLLDQLDDDLDLSNEEIEQVLDEHEIDESHHDSMDRLDQLIDQETPAPKKKGKYPIVIIASAILLLLVVLAMLLMPEDKPKYQPKTKPPREALQNNHSSLQELAKTKPTSRLKRATQSKPVAIQTKQTLQANTLSSEAMDLDQITTPETRAQPSHAQAKISSKEMTEVINFEPEKSADKNMDKKLLKLKAINKELNRELRLQQEQIDNQRQQLAAYEQQIQIIESQAAISGRTRIGGLNIIDFAAAGKVAVVSSHYSDANRIIALTQGEILKLGSSSYRVEKVSQTNKRVLIGKYYYIDQKLVSKPILGTQTKKHKTKKPDNKPSINKVAKLKPVRNWSILFASQSGDYSVIASRDNRAKRLSRGDTLPPYGIVKNILRDGSVVFKNHIIKYQSTTK